MRTYKNVISDIYPKELLHTENAHIMEFDNRHEFIYKITNKYKDVYSEKVTQFLKNIDNYEVDTRMVEKVRNQVMNNLIKRGIVTGGVYEGYKYDIEGEIIDYAELATGNPMCMMKPVKKYDKYFYELFINMSIPWHIADESITEGAIRLVETIKALEELHIEIKITVVDFAENLRLVDDRYKDHLTIVPIMNHLEYKDHRNLLPFCDSNMRRGPLFNVLNASATSVNGNLGEPKKMKNTVNLWGLKDGDEVALAERVLQDLDLKDKL